MKTVSAAKIAAQFNDCLAAIRDEPVLITRNGKVVAVLLAVQDKADAEQLVVSRSLSLRSIFEEASEQIEKGGGIPAGQFWQEVAQTRRAKGRSAGKGIGRQAR